MAVGTTIVTTGLIVGTAVGGIIEYIEDVDLDDIGVGTIVGMIGMDEAELDVTGFDITVGIAGAELDEPTLLAPYPFAPSLLEEL